jgi:pimeloyl-ACP methyl ester carboxylesterase
MKICFATMLLAFLLTPQLSLSQTSENKGSTDGFVQVAGSRIYYQECGSGPSAVVLMHDGVVDSAVWNDVWPSFCKEFRAIRYDRRGYGRSPETKNPYYEADDLATLLRDRGVTHAALVAGSHGGNVALDFTLRYPAQVSALVLIGPAAEGFPYSEHFLLAQLAFQQAKDPVDADVNSDYLTAPGNMAARQRLRVLLEAAPQDHKHNDMPLPEKPVFPYVKDIHAPTLIMTGSADIADNQAVAGALVMAIPGAARVVTPDAGHLVYLEKPNVFSSIVNGFLKRNGF